MQLARDEAQVDELLSALRSLEPDHSQPDEREIASAQHQQGVESCHAAVAAALGRARARICGAAEQSGQVERARIEEIENRLRHLRTQLESVQSERRRTREEAKRLSSSSCSATAKLIARKAGETARAELEHVLQDLQATRTRKAISTDAARRIARELRKAAQGQPGFTRGPATGRAWTGAGPRHGMARLALVR